MSLDGVSVEQRDAAWLVTLERSAQANALDSRIVESLHTVLTDAERDSARVFVLRGSGRNFSAGFDMTGLDAISDGDLLWRFTRIQLLLERLQSSSLLTVAFAHGSNFGAGVDLFAACRWRFAARGASFRMPGLAFGIVLGTLRFASIVGREQARDILEGVRTLSAQEGVQLGLIRQLITESELGAAVEDALEHTAVLPAESRRLLAETLDAEQADSSMAALVRSAAWPGFRDRVQHYFDSQRRARVRAS